MSTWHSLPTEMKIAVVQLLPIDDVKKFSKASQGMYTMCIPITFKYIKLIDFEAMQTFIAHVPTVYYHYVHRLEVCTMGSLPTNAASTENATSPRTDALVSLLRDCTNLKQLSLQLSGGLAKHVIPYFSPLGNLKQLSISNEDSERDAPISERLIVSIAASVPNLEQLTLDRISRSTLHAPELINVYPPIPLVAGDDNIDDHPQLGSTLCLPSLLRIPSLKKLTIRDTHLGDSLWLTTSPACHLEAIDLSGCSHETDDVNSLFVERIISAIGPTVVEASLSTAILGAPFARPSSTPFKQLRKLNISPYFPIESVVDTMTNLSGSPIDTISVQCFADDVVDIRSAVKDFLSLRIESGPEFHQNPIQINVSVAACNLLGMKPGNGAEVIGVA